MSRRPPSGMPLPHLMAMLSRRGWGPLTGREWQGVRSTLRALVETVPWHSAQGHVVIFDVIEAAGLSDRWVRRCIGVLDELGVIEWHPGGIAAGRPQPSWVRINKTALADLVAIAQPGHNARLLTHRAAVAARLATLRAPWIRSKRARNRGRGPAVVGSSQSELSATPTPEGGRGLRPCPSPKVNNSPRKDDDPMPMTRLPEVKPWNLPKTCPHKDPDGPSHCPLCRHSAMSPEDLAQWEAEHGPKAEDRTPSAPSETTRHLIAQAITNANKTWAR